MMTPCGVHLSGAVAPPAKLVAELSIPVNGELLAGHSTTALESMTAMQLTTVTSTSPMLFESLQ